MKRLNRLYFIAIYCEDDGPALIIPLLLIMHQKMKMIDGIFYHHLKHQEKDFGLTFSGALCAVFSFVGHFWGFLLIIIGLLSNWDAFYNLREFLSRSTLI